MSQSSSKSPVRLLVLLMASASASAAGLEVAPSAQAIGVPSLVLSEPLTLRREGARNPTVAIGRRSGVLYIAWAQEVPGAAPKEKDGKKVDPKLQVLLARSTDGGRQFGPPVVVSTPEDHVASHTVSPTQVVVGPKGEVYVLYEHSDKEFKVPGWQWGRTLLRLARSDDGGQSFSAPMEIAGEALEGVLTSVGMLNLFVAPNGDLYASWLDSREPIAYMLAHQKEPPQEEYPPYQLRVARSRDGGGSFGKSVLVSKPTCGCCGTKVAQGAGGPLFATTRAQAEELKGSYDAVRDVFVSSSHDGGASWAKAVKIHDDRFKISACPDITSGLAVDSRGRLHAAWYTGTERHPGVFYAVSSDEGKSFCKPLALLADDWVPYGDVKLALDGNDNAWVAFEDRRGEEDMIQLARITPEGTRTLSQAWSGTAPDVAVLGDSAVIAWGTQAPEGEEEGGGIQVLIARP